MHTALQWLVDEWLTQARLQHQVQCSCAHQRQLLDYFVRMRERIALQALIHQGRPVLARIDQTIADLGDQLETPITEIDAARVRDLVDVYHQAQACDLATRARMTRRAQSFDLAETA